MKRKRAFTILLAAVASLLVMAIGYTAFLAGVHDLGPFQKVLQATGLPFLSLALLFDVEPSNLASGLAIAAGAVLWFALFKCSNRMANPLLISQKGAGGGDR